MARRDAPISPAPVSRPAGPDQVSFDGSLAGAPSRSESLSLPIVDGPLKARVKVRVTYLPLGGSANTRAWKVKLVRK